MTLVFSLVGGLLIAVVLQLVFANLGIALGLTLLDFSPRRALSGPAEDGTDRSNSGEAQDESEAEQTSFSLPVTHLLGFSVAIGLSMVIFVGTLLSVEFSGLLELRQGIIFGLVFWSTYWLLFIWLCSTTVTGIADSLIGGAIASGKQLIATVKQSITAPDSPSDKAVEQTLIRELAAEVSKLANAQDEIPQLLASQQDRLLSQINAAIEERLESEDLEEERSNDTKSPEPPPEQSRTQVTVTESRTEPDRKPAPEVAVSDSSSSLLSQLDLPSWQQIAKSAINQVDLSEWDVETLLQQLPVDSSNPKSVASQMMGSAIALLPDTNSHTESSDRSPENLTNQPKNFSATRPSADHSAAIQTIQTKLEDYCRYTNVGSLTPEKLSEKVCSQLEEYDLSAADVSNSERSLDIASIESVLSRRQNLPTQNKQQLIAALEQVWPSIPLTPEPTAEPVAADTSESKDSLDELPDRDLSLQSVAEKAYQTVDNHLQKIDWDAVSLEDIKPELNTLLSQLEREGSLASIDWQALVSRVKIHHDVREEFTDWLKTALTSQLRSVRPVVVHTAEDLSQYVSEQITNFLKNREKPDLQPEKAAQALSQLVSGAIASLPHPAKLADLASLNISLDRVLWDKDKWQQVLESRKDMSAEEIHQVIEWGEHVWQPKAKQISGWLQAVQAEVSQYLSLPNVSLPDVNLPDVNLPDRDSVVATGQQINEQITTVQTAVSEQITAVKEDIQAQVTAVKEDIQEQVDDGRRQLAIAAWWLFIAFVSSGSAAAGAGWLAIAY